MDSDITKAYEIVNQLQDWIDNHDAMSTIPHPGFTWTTTTLQIFVGNVTVYCSEGSGGDEFNFESCRDEFIKDCREYAPFANDPLSL